MARGQHDIRYALQVMSSFSMVHLSVTACGHEHTFCCMTVLCMLYSMEENGACHLAWEYHDSKVTDNVACTALTFGRGQLGPRQ